MNRPVPVVISSAMPAATSARPPLIITRGEIPRSIIWALAAETKKAITVPGM